MNCDENLDSKLCYRLYSRQKEIFSLQKKEKNSGWIPHTHVCARAFFSHSRTCTHTRMYIQCSFLPENIFASGIMQKWGRKKTQLWSLTLIFWFLFWQQEQFAVCVCLSYMKDQCSPYTLIKEVYSTVFKRNVTTFLLSHFCKPTKIFERIFVININRQHKFKKFSEFIQ